MNDHQLKIKSEINALIRTRRTYFDGAFGTLLQSKGLAPGEAPELWNIKKPILNEANNKGLHSSKRHKHWPITVNKVLFFLSSVLHAKIIIYIVFLIVIDAARIKVNNLQKFSNSSKNSRLAKNS